MNTKELSSKGFVSSILIVYLLVILSLVGIITDKVIKTSQTLINIKEYNDYFKMESSGIFHLRKYLEGLKEHDELVAQYELDLEEYNKQKEEYELNNEEIPEDLKEPEEVEEYPDIEMVYVDGIPIYYELMDNYCEIYYLDVELDVKINNYRVIDYKLS